MQQMILKIAPPYNDEIIDKIREGFIGLLGMMSSLVLKKTKAFSADLSHTRTAEFLTQA